MPGTLFVVATPIGNLEDITLRALRVLRDVDVIAAEDTRHTGRLLAHFAIPTPTISFHEHNTRTRVPQLISRLTAGQSIALVTDAGTPGISDPGVELIDGCLRAGVPVDPLPGASAPLAAAIGSGFPVLPLTILGFAPVRPKDRSAFFEVISSISWTVTFFEAPHRVQKTLAEAGLYLGERPIVIARELTKVHQEFLRGRASELSTLLSAPKGEFTVVVGPAERIRDVGVKPSDGDLAAEFGRIAESGGVSRREAVVAVARKFGCPSREVYAAVERAKKSGV